MAEAAQASPVVLDSTEDKDNPEAQTTSVASAPVTDKDESEVTTFATPIEEAVTYNEDGTPKLLVDPIKVKPRPSANVPTREIVTQVYPPRAEFKSLESDVLASVARAEEPEPPLTYESVLDKLNAGETVVLDGAKGEEKYVGQRSATLISQSQSLERQLRLAIAIDASKKAQQPPDDTLPERPTQAFVTDEGTIDVGSVDPELRPVATTYAEGRLALDKIISRHINTGRPDIDLAVRQYFSDDFEMGESLQNFGYRFSETRRFFQNGITAYGPVMARSAVEAYNRANELGTTFSDEWQALAGEREKSIQSIFRFMDENGGSPTAALYFNDMIQERVRNDPNLSDEQKEYILYDTATSGEKFERQLVNDEMAYSIIEESFMEMSRLEQWGVIFAEGLFGGGVFGQVKNAKSIKSKDKFLKFTKDNGLDYFDFSVAQVRQLALSQGKKIKHSNEMLELGFYNKAIQKQSGDALARIQKLTKDLDKEKLKPKNLRNANTIDILESEIKNLSRLRRKSYYKQTLSPFMSEIIGPDAALAGFAVAGRSLSGTFGMDEETGEVVGLVKGLASELTGLSRVGLKVTKFAVTKPLGLGVGLARSITPEGILNPLNAFYNKITQADMTIEDYERTVFKPRHDRDMNRNERKMLKASFNQVEKMDYETKQAFLDKLSEGVELQNEVLNMFPEGPERIKAAAALDGALGEVLGIPRVMNAYEAATEDALTKGIKKEGLGAMVSALQDADKRLSKAQLLLSNFENQVASLGNPTLKTASARLIDATKNSLAGMEITFLEESEKLNNKIGDMLVMAVEDVTMPLDDDFFASFLEVQDILKRRLGEGSEQVAGLERAKVDLQEVRDNSLIVNKALLERFKQVRARKDIKDLSNSSLESAVESLVFARYGKLAAEMDAPYEGFREFVAKGPRPKIDIAPAVQEMLKLANADERNITTFFGPSATFFSGFMGKRSMKMFDRMVKRTLSELPEEERTEMFTALVESGVDAEDLEKLLRENPVQFGLLLHQNGKLNVFANANIEEAEEFRRAFRDYGYKTNNPAVSREYRNFSNLIDGIMKEGDPEGHVILEEARAAYTQLNDPSRQGSVLQRILASKVGEKQTLDESGLSGIYKGKTPFEIIGEVGKTVEKIMSGPRNLEEMSKLKQQIGGLSQLFGTPGLDGKMRIDLRTEEGQVAMELLEEVIEAFVYNGWAGDFLSRQPTVGSRIRDPRSLGWKNTIQEQLEGINDAFQVNIIDKNGNNDQSLVFNITNMLSAEKDISTLIQKGGKYHDKGVKAVRKLSSVLKESASANKVQVAREQAAVKDLQDIIKIEGDTTNFYDKYIAGFSDTDLLRDQFMLVAKKDPNLKGADLDKLFDHAVRDMTYQALMKKGQYGPVGTKTATRLKGSDGLLSGEEDNLLINGLASTEGLLAELENPNVVNNLLKIMPEEQIKSLQNITRYLQRQQANKIAGKLIHQGMSAESALSRAYNIARGQVGVTYVVSEVALRLIRKNNSDALLLAISSPDAARIMDKMMNYPDLITNKDLKTFDILLQGFLSIEVARKGNEALMKDYMDLYTGDKEPQTKEENDDETSTEEQ